jgi:formate C-acetyltransferase
MWQQFEKDREHLANQYDQPHWNELSGLNEEQLKAESSRLLNLLAEQPRSIIKARLYELIMRNAQLDIDPADWFADRLNHCDILIQLRKTWWLKIDETVMSPVQEKRTAARETGSYSTTADFSHTSPDWPAVLSLGLPGLLSRIRQECEIKKQQGTLTQDQAIFYESAEIVYQATIDLLRRMAEEARTKVSQSVKMKYVSRNLQVLSERAPETLPEALQLMYLFWQLQELVEGERVRSLGGLDRLLNHFFQGDLIQKRYTWDQEKEFIQYFLFKIFARKTPFNQPFYLGGLLPDGADAITDLSWLILETYDELAICDPKIHIRVHPDSPGHFLQRALECIRRGNSSIVFLNDTVAIASLCRQYAHEMEAREYVPIGCYEPAVMGLEIPCTGTAGVNMAKAFELALNQGMDPLTGRQIGAVTAPPQQIRTFDQFLAIVKEQLSDMIQQAINVVIKYEKHYLEINPSPLFSGTLQTCVQKGKDAYAGGAKYNNSSVNCACIASLVDSLLSLDKVVFRDRIMALEDMRKLLAQNWSGQDKLRLQMRQFPEKYGNNRPVPDQLACSLADFAAEQINGKPNGRGGIFKAGMISIDHYHAYGMKMGATPDGRLAHEPLSKNFSAMTAMDRAGITALIDSVTKIDHSLFSNGSVLDILLHPSAVQGMEGLDKMLALIRTYFTQGGFAIHGNVFDAQTLMNAQEKPDQYATLQVRVCGWNVYFVNLSKSEQDEFIRHARHVAV